MHRRTLLMSLASAPLLSIVGCSADGEGDATRPLATIDVDEIMTEQALPPIAKGDRAAPVTVVEYASMTCGFCRRFHLETYDEIIERYVDTGRVRFELREFPFDPRAMGAAMLVRCASEERREPLIDALYEAQPEWSRAENGQQALFDVVRLAGFTEERFRKCLTDQDLVDKIETVAARGRELGVEATPTFFVNGAKYSGHKSVDEMSAIIDAAL